VIEGLWTSNQGSRGTEVSASAATRMLVLWFAFFKAAAAQQGHYQLPRRTTQGVAVSNRNPQTKAKELLHGVASDLDPRNAKAPPLR